MEELFDFVEFLVSSAGEELTILEIRSSTLSLLHILSLSQPYAGNESQIKNRIRSRNNSLQTKLRNYIYLHVSFSFCERNYFHGELVILFGLN